MAYENSILYDPFSEEEELEEEPLQSLPEKSYSPDDPELIDSVIWQESRGKSDAVSPAGAQGLMQIMPKTFEAYSDEGDDPFNPEDNKKVGVRYLKEQYDTFGSIELALAAYNAGPGRVKRLQATYGEDYEDIKAHLPAETQNYVPSIINNYESKLSKKKEEAPEGPPEEELAAPEKPAYSNMSIGGEASGGGGGGGQKDYSLGTKKELADRWYDVITAPGYSELSLSDRIEKLSGIYNSQKWEPDTFDFVKNVSDHLLTAASPEEVPNVASIVTSLAGPPPRLEEGDSDPDKTLETWKNDVYRALWKQKINPAYFGSLLDTTLNAMVEREKSAFEIRNRSAIGYAYNQAYDTGRELLKGGIAGVTDPMSAIARYGLSAVAPESAEKVGDFIASAPELLGKPSDDFTYETDEDGYIQIGTDGLPVTRLRATIARGVGQVATLLTGGAMLKGGLATLGLGGKSLMTAMGGVNTLTVMEMARQETLAEGGSTEEAFTAGLHAAPVGAMTALGSYLVVAGMAPASIAGLSNFNKAKVLSSAMLKASAIEGVTNLGQQYGQSRVVSDVLGKNVVTEEKLKTAAIFGAVAGGLFKGVETYMTPPPPKPKAPPPALEMLPYTERLGLPPGTVPKELPGAVPGGQKALGGTGRIVQGPEDSFRMYHETPPDEAFEVGRAFEDFEKSDADVTHFTREQFNNIPPELLRHMDVVRDDQGGATFTKRYTYVDVEGGDTLKQHDEAIVKNVNYLLDNPSPEKVPSLIEKRKALKAQKEKIAEPYKKQENFKDYYDVRTRMQKLYDKAAADFDEAPAGSVAKDAARLEVEDLARQIEGFEEAHKKTNFKEGWEALSPLDDEIKTIGRQLKKALNPSEPYLNNLAKAHRNLRGLLKSREALKKQLDAKLSKMQLEDADAFAASIASKLEHAGIDENVLAKDFSKGVVVDGNTIFPYKNKWYVLDSKGRIYGAGHEYFEDAAHAYTDKLKTKKFMRERARSFIMKEPVPERTAYTPDQEKAIIEKVQADKKAKEANDAIVKKLREEEFEEEKAVNKIIEELLHTKGTLKAAKGKKKAKGKASSETAEDTDTVEQANDVATTPEEQAASINEAGDIVKRWKITLPNGKAYYNWADTKEVVIRRSIKKFKEAPVSVEPAVSPLTVKIRSGEIPAEEADRAPGMLSSDVEGLVGRVVPVSSFSISRIRPSVYKHPLTSNYTKPHVFSKQSTNIVQPADLHKAAQSVANALPNKPPLTVGGAMPPSSLPGYRKVGFMDYIKNFWKVARHNDPSTLSHELFHNVSRALIGKWNMISQANYSHIPAKVIEAVKDMADKIYEAPLPDNNLKVEEGFAVFFQNYATGQPVRKEVEAWYHDQFARENPKVYKALEKFKDLTLAYGEMDPFAAIHSQLIDRESSLKVPTRDEAATDLIDRWGALHDMDNATAIDPKTKQHTGKAYKLRSVNYRRAHQIVKNFLRGQPTDYLTNQPISIMNLKQILKSIKGKEYIFEAGAVARRAGATMKKGIEPGYSLEDISAVAKEIHNNHPDVERALNQFGDLTDAFLNFVSTTSKQGNNWVAQIQADNLKTTGTKHAYWLPFGRGGYAKVISTFMRKGSTKPIYHAFDEIEAQWTKLLDNSLKSQVNEEIIRASSGPEQNFTGRFVREIKAGSQRLGLEQEFDLRIKKANNGVTPTPKERGQLGLFVTELPGVSGKDFQTMVLMDGNRPRFFEVNKAIKTAMDDSIPEIAKNPFYRLLWQYPAQTLRVSATALRESFQLRQLIKDPVNAWMYLDTSGIGAKDAVIMAKHIAEQLVAIPMYFMGNKSAQQGWFAAIVRMGGGGSTYLGAEAGLLKGSNSRYFNLLGYTLGKLENVIGTPERATRTAAVIHRARTKWNITDPNQAMSPEIIMDLLETYNESTINFSRQGRLTRIWNMHIPFLTANIAAWTKVPMDIKRNPRKMAAVMGGALAAGVAHALARKDEKSYQEIEPWFKMQNIMIPFTDENGIEKEGYLPLAPGVSSAWGLGQAIGNAMSKDPLLAPSYTELAKAYFSQILPIQSLADVTGVIPKEIIQQEANWDYYFKKPIVPLAFDFKDSREQWDDYTTELSKSVGAATGASPMKLDHAIKSLSPAAYDLLQFSDRVLGYKKAKEQKSMNFIANAFSRAGTRDAIMDRSQRLFYNHLKDYRKNVFKETPEEEVTRKKLNKLAMTISDLSIYISGTDNTELKDELRRKKRELLDLGIALAKGMTQEEIEASPFKEKAKEIKEARNQAHRDRASKEK